MSPTAGIILFITSMIVLIIGFIKLVKYTHEQEKVFQDILKGKVKYKTPKVGFFALLEKCFELENKNSASRDRYVPCIAYTNAQTFGGAIKK